MPIKRSPTYTLNTLTYLSEAAYRTDMVLSMGRSKVYLPMEAEDKCFCPLNQLYILFCIPDYYSTILFYNSLYEIINLVIKY